MAGECPSPRVVTTPPPNLTLSSTGRAGPAVLFNLQVCSSFAVCLCLSNVDSYYLKESLHIKPVRTNVRILISDTVCETQHACGSSADQIARSVCPK